MYPFILFAKNSEPGTRGFQAAVDLIIAEFTIQVKKILSKEKKKNNKKVQLNQGHSHTFVI